MPLRYNLFIFQKYKQKDTDKRLSAVTSDIDRQFRQSLRLKGYDYALAGAYFLTIVAQNRACLFGTIQDNTMVLSPTGEMLQSVWQALPARFPNVVLDAAVVMPNHFHAIMIFVGASLVGASLGSSNDGTDAQQKLPTRGTPTKNPTLGTVVGAWKSLTTVEYIAGVKTQGWKPFAGQLWQRNYYEHVVRDDEDLARIRYYIATNPQDWMEDAENPMKRAS
jgi:putative transposase